MLQGPRVPKEFKSDGCSCSPDNWRYHPCRVHDYNAWYLRANWQAVTNSSGKKCLAYILNEDGIFEGVLMEKKQAYEHYYREVKRTQDQFKENLKIMSQYYIHPTTGEPTRRRWYSMARPSRFLTPKLYYWATNKVTKWRKKENEVQ